MHVCYLCHFCSLRILSTSSLSLRDKHLTLRKIAIWLTKNCQWQFFGKKLKIFGNFFGKNVKFFAIFSQSNGNLPEGQVRNEVIFLSNCNMHYTAQYLAPSDFLLKLLICANCGYSIWRKKNPLSNAIKIQYNIFSTLHYRIRVWLYTEMEFPSCIEQI